MQDHVEILQKHLVMGYGIAWAISDSISVPNTICVLLAEWNINFRNFSLCWADSVPSPGGRICISISYHQSHWYYWWLVLNQTQPGVSWWRHQMEIFSALLAICAGNSPVPGEFPTQRPVTRSFDVFFDLRLNKQLNKQSCGWWFETPSGSLWRQRNVKLRTGSGPVYWRIVVRVHFFSGFLCRRHRTLTIFVELFWWNVNTCVFTLLFLHIERAPCWNILLCRKSGLRTCEKVPLIGFLSASN